MDLQNLKEEEIKSLSDSKLINFLKESNKKYRDGIEIISDDLYDLMEEELRNRDPKNPFLKKIGGPVREDVVKKKLPVRMGGLDKVSPDSRELELYLERFPSPYFISEKADGISGLIVYDESGDVKIFTRGDGDVGQDISFLKDSIRIPKIQKTVCIRGEFMIKKSVFEKKYAKDFPKARSVVNSIINSKKPNQQILKDIDFLGYEVVKNNADKWSTQFQELEEYGFIVVDHVVESKITSQKLVELYRKMKETSIYEIDGLVLSSNYPFKRTKTGNPKYSVKFKVNTTGTKTTVEYIEWNPSKYGILVPRVKIKTIVLGGDNINYVTAHNARFVEENRLGIGSEIKVVKSGDVIPYILDVVTKKKPYFPKVDYIWNDTHVEIILKNPEKNEEVQIKRLLHFFQTMRIEFISIGTVTKFYNFGLNTVKKIYYSSIEDFMKIPTFKEKSSTKIYNAIHSVLDQNIPLERLMAASLSFDNGFGEKKLKAVLEVYPTLLEKDLSMEDIIKVESYSDKSAEKFLEYLPRFRDFLKENNYLKFSKIKKEKKFSKVVVFSGFRDKELEKRIEEIGGKIGSSVTSKTDLLIVKDDSGSSKVKKAKELGIKIMKRDKLNF